jgi:hypothetical protein
MIDGLKLTVTGEELRTLLEERIEDHQRRVQRYKWEQARTPEEQTEDDEPLLPGHICANEAERYLAGARMSSALFVSTSIQQRHTD